MGERQLSLNDLNERVQEINAANGRALAENDAARAQYRDLLAQLHETNDEIVLVQSENVASASPL